MLKNPLKIKDLKKTFATKVVLDNISLDLHDNEIFGLIGLNGVGKTTLIKIILDLLDADSGLVDILGIKSTSPKSKQLLRYLPEKFQASSMVTGLEFLKIFNDFDKSYDGDKKKLLDEIYRLANLLALDRNALNLKVSKYSKGMTQKLGLISTFLGQSKLIILDEPMTGLDPKARIYLKNLLRESKSQNKTVFFSSHILSDIDEICDRIGVLNNGKICFIGTPTELKEKHKEDSLEKAFLKEIM